MCNAADSGLDRSNRPAGVVSPSNHKAVERGASELIVDLERHHQRAHHPGEGRPEDAQSISRRYPAAVRIPRLREWRGRGGRRRAGRHRQGEAHAQPREEPEVHRWGSLRWTATGTIWRACGGCWRDERTRLTTDAAFSYCTRVSSSAPTMYCTSSWVFVSVVRFSVTLRPLCITMRRSETAKTSGSVWVIRMTGTP